MNPYFGTILISADEEINAALIPGRNKSIDSPVRITETDALKLTPAIEEPGWSETTGFLGAWATYSFGTLINPINLAYQGGQAGAAWKLGVYGSFRTALAVEFFWGALIVGFATTLADPQHLYTPPGYSPIDLWFERQVVNPSRPNFMSISFRRQLQKVA